MSKYNSNVGKNRIKAIIKNKDSHVHFVGVGGVGMYSLFRLTELSCRRVSGSDREESRLTSALKKRGAAIRIGHSAENVKEADLAVYTLALSEDNPEVSYALESSVPTASRAEYLGAIMEEYKERIGVSGTHGKTTTTAMLDAIFARAGREPTTVLGAIIPGMDEPLRIGKKDFFIYEACEYMDSFLSFSPTVSVFTNIELDHVDYFKDIEALKKSFLSAMSMSGLCVVNSDDENLCSLIPFLKNRCVSFGTGEDADYRVTEIRQKQGRYSFKIRHEGVDKLEISLNAPGRFNVMNAAAAAALSCEVGIPGAYIEEALRSFSGVERRLERLGEYNGAQVFYDYAHHPTEIECAIKSVRELCPGRAAVIFKPHTYSRTAAFIEEFASALSLADVVLLCDISAIRERDTLGVSSELLASKIKCRAKYVTDEDCARELLCESFDSLIIMGAANLDKVKHQLFGK